MPSKLSLTIRCVKRNLRKKKSRLSWLGSTTYSKMSHFLSLIYANVWNNKHSDGNKTGSTCTGSYSCSVAVSWRRENALAGLSEMRCLTNSLQTQIYVRTWDIRKMHPLGTIPSPQFIQRFHIRHYYKQPTHDQWKYSRKRKTQIDGDPDHPVNISRIKCPKKKSTFLKQITFLSPFILSLQNVCEVNASRWVSKEDCHYPVNNQVYD